MASYVEKLLATKGVCAINDERTIYTDRMGPWKNQDVVLTWEGEQEKEFISVTPDEVEVLFKNGKTRNVYRGEDGRLYKGWIFADYRYFPGAIVCGVMAPSTAASMIQ